MFDLFFLICFYIYKGSWAFDMSWWNNISWEARDFITKLLVYQADDRLDVRSALRHPWFERLETRFTDEYRIESRYLHDYFRLYR